jgi:hypothetical protein
MPILLKPPLRFAGSEGRLGSRVRNEGADPQPSRDAWQERGERQLPIDEEERCLKVL